MNNMKDNIPCSPPKLVVIMKAVLGIAAVVIAITLSIIVWPALVAGHPVYPVLLGIILITGIMLLVRCQRPRRTGRIHKILRVTGGIVFVLILAIMIFLKPFPANEAGVEAAVSTSTIEVVHRWDAWELRPKGESSNVGVVFLPGMLVDPRAFFPLLKPLAEQGVLVIVPTAPLGMPLNGAQATKHAIASSPDIKTWVIGGHSMGGAMAASIAAKNPDINGLMIWGSYSTVDLTKSDVAVSLIYGTNDPFANTEMIDSARNFLPPDTRYVPIEGGVHAYFADYTQPGDGEPGIDRATAERLIIAETESFIKSLTQN